MALLSPGSGGKVRWRVLLSGIFPDRGLLAQSEVAESFVECGDTPAVGQLLGPARPCRMAKRIYIEAELCAGFSVSGTGTKDAAVRHDNVDQVVIGMYVFFHGNLFPSIKRSHP